MKTLYHVTTALKTTIKDKNKFLATETLIYNVKSNFCPYTDAVDAFVYPGLGDDEFTGRAYLSFYVSAEYASEIESVVESLISDLSLSDNGTFLVTSIEFSRIEQLDKIEPEWRGAVPFSSDEDEMLTCHGIVRLYTQDDVAE